MIKINKAVRNTPQFPLDCWCVIMSFLSSFKDYLKLIMSIRGLHTHMKSIQPKSTENVVFQLKNFLPNEVLKYVGSLKWVLNEGETESMEEMEKKFSFTSFNNIFEKIIWKFPNLISLSIKIQPYYHAKEFWYKQERILQKFSNSEYSNLRILELKISFCKKLTIQNEFPNVHTLYLRNFNTYEYGSGKDSRFPRCFLKCDWKKCFKSVIHLNVSGLKLLDGFDQEVKNQIISLRLSNSGVSDEKEYLGLGVHVLSGFGNLRSLILKGSAIRYFKIRGDKMMNLKNLEIIEDCILMDIECQECNIPDLIIPSIPSLTSLHLAMLNMDSTDADWSEYEYSDVQIEKQDNLEEFKCSHIPSSIFLKNCKKLRKIESKGCWIGIEISKPSMCLNLKEILVENSPLGKNLWKVVNYLKEKKKLKYTGNLKKKE